MPSSRVAARTPDTLWMLAALAVVGVIITTTGAVPTPVADVIPAWAARVWAATFTAAAALSLVGLLWREPGTGWRLEGAGRAALAVTALGYFAALVDDAEQWEVTLSVALVGSVAVSSAWRVVQIAHRLRAARADHRGHE